ncbi:hypothetical protein [Pseudoduganella namucuonensis]|uniref:Uncharacterized protein n=1 Tax=Pseudoduganella namucuonensis TaxID=1035707 RepID=A0A1I7I5Q3_9BURK|nr:hypothetical protein [Pseudoduganella namucuonensis]SFU68289.1 hypothetical protein SAMN05216552_1007117 [Pseudoduganella namucuonensis]
MKLKQKRKQRQDQQGMRMQELQQQGYVQQGGGMQQGSAINQQSASDVSAEATRRNRSTGARGDSTHQRYNSGVMKDDIKRAEGDRTRSDKQIR